MADHWIVLFQRAISTGVDTIVILSILLFGVQINETEIHIFIYATASIERL